MEKAISKTHSLYSEQTALKKGAIIALLSSSFAFFGWVGETLLFYFLYREFHDRGLLTLPFCHLYGFGSLAVYAALRTPQSGVWKKLYCRPRTKAGKFFAVIGCVILYALAAALLASVVEYLTGMFFDRKFGVHLWGYRRYPDNINGYVSVRYSLLWGLLCVSAMGLIWYPMSELLAKCNTATLVTVAAVVVTVIACDFIFNMVYLYRFGTRFLPAEKYLPRALTLSPPY